MHDPILSGKTLAGIDADGRLNKLPTERISVHY